jgi:hypothetical protein
MPTAGGALTSGPAAACELGPMRDPVRDNHLGRPSTAPDMHGHRTARDQGLLVFICTAEKYCNRAAPARQCRTPLPSLACAGTSRDCPANLWGSKGQINRACPREHS